MGLFKNVFDVVTGKERRRRNAFPGSAAYWQNRYMSGGNSGAGSYNRLAVFKADTINEFVEKNRIDSVIEFGCGDGNQLTLAKYNKYIGFDVSKSALERCRDRFSSDNTKEFKEYDGYSGETSQLSLSLDVIYHLIEDDVYDLYMRRLFKSSSRYVIIYSSNEDRWQELHVRHRKFTDWVSENITESTLIDRIDNKYPFDKKNKNATSFSNFYIYSINAG